MRTDVVLVAALFAGLVLSAAVPASAQESVSPSLFLVDTDTRIASVGFDFPGGSTLERSRLRQSIAQRGPGGLAGLRSTFSFLPGVSSPTYARFSPIGLQRDVVRLRRLYQRSGFPDVEVDYDVVLDTARNRVDVKFVIEQGTPLTVDSVDVRLSEVGGTEVREDASSEVRLPAELEDAWREHRSRLARARGRRFGEQERARLEGETRQWLLERGYPWAEVGLGAADTIDSAVSVELIVMPGPRAKVDEIALEGNRRLARDVVTREIPIRIGDWYDASRVSEGERELFELELVRRALGDVVADQPRDSTVTLRFRIDEGRPRLIWGRIGWRSESGVAGEAHWVHRDFLGGARSFTVSTNVESGWGGLEASRGRNVGVSALVRQPYVLQRTMSATFGPFARFRDDFRDQSVLFGLETGLIYRKRPLEAVTLQHELSRLRVDDAFQLTPVRDLVETGDSLFAPIFVRSVFRLAGVYGNLDDRIDPRSGYIIEPALEVTGPTGLSDVEFFRASVQAMAAVPFSGRTGLFLRGSAGRLFPFGESDPESGASRTRSTVGLRGVMLTAGGPADVRGWGRGLVGSKIPDVVVSGDGEVSAGRFVPAGGLARVTGSAELGLPFPFLNRPYGTHVFFDAGRVWSPGDVFDPGDPELVLEGWAYSVGAGVQIGTLVGPIRLSVGYKLNPTTVDLLGPGEVARALVDGIPLEGLEGASFRRWHIHLSIGRGL